MAATEYRSDINLEELPGRLADHAANRRRMIV
jgi:hypothetical protein